MKLWKLLILVLLIMTVQQLIGQYASLPYAQNFDASGSMPAGWDRIMPTGYNGLSVYGYYDQSEPNCLYYWSDSCTASDYMMGVAPAVNWDYYPDATLTFSAGMYTEELLRSIEIGYITDIANLSTYVPLSAFTLSQGYQTFNLDLSTLTGSSRLCFRFMANSPQQGMFLDDILINITTNPFISLPYSQNFDAALTMPDGWNSLINVDGYSATIAVGAGQASTTPNSLQLWCENYTGEYTDIFSILPEYDIYAQPAPYLAFRAKTNSIIGAMPRLEVGFISDTEDPATFSLVRSWRLSNNFMDYTIDFSEFRSGSRLALRICPTQANQYIYVDNVEVLPTAPVIEPPVGGLITLPHYENFDAFTGGVEVPEGWNRIFTPAEAGYVGIYGAYGTSDPNCLYYWNSTSADLSPRLAAVMPGFDTTMLSEIYFNFTASCYTESTMPLLSFGYLTDPADIGTFQLINSITLSQEAQAYSYSISAPGGNVYVAFIMEPNDVQQGMAIDDIALTVEPYAGAYVTLPYRENFDTYEEYGWPTGWSSIVQSPTWNGDVSLSNDNSYSSPYCLNIYNGGDTLPTSTWMAVGPSVHNEDIQGNTLHFRARTFGDVENPERVLPGLAVGYLDDRLNPAGFQSVALINLTGDYLDYEVTIPSGIYGSLRAFAFKLMPTAEYQAVMIDDVYFGTTALYELIDLPYVQNFDGCENEALPPDWRYLMNSSDSNANIRTNDYNYESEYYSLEMNNESDTDSGSYWIAAFPAIRSSQLGNCLVKFNAMGYDQDYEDAPGLTLGYMTDRTDASTFVSIQSIDLPDWFDEFSIPVPAPPRVEQIFLAFRMDVTGEYQTLNIDDVRIETMGELARLLPFYEDFEADPFPAEGWMDVPVDLGTEYDENAYWYKYVDAYGDRIQIPDVYDGTGMAVFARVTAGNSSRLTTPYLDLRGAGQVTVSFAVAHTDSYSSSQYDNEGIQLQVSTDGILWTNVGDFIQRSDSDAMDYYWENYAFDVSQYIGNPAVRFGLLGRSMHGMNIYVDKFQVIGATSLGAPQNLEILVSAGFVAMNWDAVEAANSYIVYSAPTPDGPFTEDLSGAYWGNGWSTSAPVTEGQKFYRVVASTEPERSNSTRNSKK